jgi:hypothetical protein
MAAAVVGIPVLSVLGTADGDVGTSQEYLQVSADTSQSF